MSLFAVVVFFELELDARTSFIELVTANAKTSVEVEPACHRFDVLVSEDRPNSVMLYELYADKAAFELHLASSHFKAFDALSKSMVATKAVTIYEATTNSDGVS